MPDHGAMHTDMVQQTMGGKLLYRGAQPGLGVASADKARKKQPDI
jgi:hypothetical protein